MFCEYSRAMHGAVGETFEEAMDPYCFIDWHRENFRSPRLGNTLGFYCFPCLTDSHYWVFLSIPKMGFLHDMGII